MLKSVQRLDYASILLAHKPSCQITLDIVEAQSDIDFEITLHLLENAPSILPKESTIKRLLSLHWEESKVPSLTRGLETSWKRNPALRVDTEMLEMTLKPQIAEWLLDHADSSLMTTPKMLRSSCPEIVGMILKHEPTFKLTSTLALELVRENHGPAFLDILLRHDPELQLSEPVSLEVCHVKSSPNYCAYELRGVFEVLRKHGVKLRYTKRMREVVQKTLGTVTDPELRELLDSVDGGSAAILA